MESLGRNELEVGFSDLSIGHCSVGLPPSYGCEQIIEAYLDLITMVRIDRPDYLRDGDIATLSERTKLDEGFIMNRVRNHLSGLSIPA